MLYIVTYDITDTKRRNRVAKILLDYGTRVQYSVFECRLEKAGLFEKMYRRLLYSIKQEEDNLRIYSLCKLCNSGIIIEGTATIPKDEDFYII